MELSSRQVLLSPKRSRRMRSGRAFRQRKLDCATRQLIMKVCQLIPRIGSLGCGVGDYAALLAGRLDEGH